MFPFLFSTLCSTEKTANEDNLAPECAYYKLYGSQSQFQPVQMRRHNNWRYHPAKAHWSITMDFGFWIWIWSLGCGIWILIKCFERLSSAFYAEIET